MSRAIRRRLFTLTLPVLSFLGCQSAAPPEKRVEVSNAGFKLDQLFTDDRGYAVYRFYDMGEYRYYVVSPDGHPQMLPTTKTVRDRDAFDDGTPGVRVGVGLGTGGTPRR